MSNRRVLLSCTVVSVQDYGFVYPSCEFCVSRLIQEDQSRCRCPKCGYTCDVKNVDYRYRLSLKVLRDTNIFGVTVFGGCLNPFFGIAAGGLQRFVESEKTEGPHSLQQLLAKAVEDCFIGKCFIFGFKLSGLETESILHGERTSTLHDVHFVACQIFPTNGASLGLTVFSYLRNLMQACTDSSCPPNPVNQSEQKDSSVTSFSHTLPLCMSLHMEHSTERLTHPWNEISDLDLCFSPGETSERSSSLQPSLDNAECIVSQYVPQSDLKNEPSLALKGIEDTENVQQAEGCVDIRCSTLHKSSTSVHLDSSPFKSGVHVTEMTGCNHWSTPIRESTASYLEKPFYSGQNSFTLDDPPLSESLGAFISQNVLSPINNYSLWKRDQVLSVTKKLKTDTISRCTPVVGTSLSNEPMFTPLSNITNAIRDKNVKCSQKQEHTKQKTLSKTHALRASRTSSSKNDLTSRDLCFQNDQICFNEPTNSKKDQEGLSESQEDGFNCSSDLFQQNSLDKISLGVADAFISTMDQTKKDFVTKRRSSSFNFAPSLQSTPISYPYQNHAHKQWGKGSRSQWSRKQMTIITNNRDLQENIDVTQIGFTKKHKAELNQTHGSDSAFENYERSAGGFEGEENKHQPEESAAFNEWSRDLFDHSF